MIRFLRLCWRIVTLSISLQRATAYRSTAGRCLRLWMSYWMSNTCQPVTLFLYVYCLRTRCVLPISVTLRRWLAILVSVYTLVPRAEPFRSRRSLNLFRYEDPSNGKSAQSCQLHAENLHGGRKSSW